MSYYIWCKDAAENISARYRIELHDGASSVWLDPVGGSARLIGRFYDPVRFPVSACDINGSGTVDGTDTQKVLDHLTGNNRLISDLAVDTDGDGSASILDAIRVELNAGKPREN